MKIFLSSKEIKELKEIKEKIEKILKRKKREEKKISNSFIKAFGVMKNSFSDTPSSKYISKIRKEWRKNI